MTADDHRRQAAGGAADPPDGQAEVVAFLCDPSSWHPSPEEVVHVETHGAHVFLAGRRVLKIKRATRFSYMDFSTLEQRHSACEREVAINRRFAPDIYLGVLAITREADGRLAIGGGGRVVEWAVEMRRFDDGLLLSKLAAKGPLAAPLVKSLAAAVLEQHRTADRDLMIDAAGSLKRTVDNVAADLMRLARGEALSHAQMFADRGRAAAARLAPLVTMRRDQGFVRRCHGDLHLNNIVLIEGRPTLFDALDFDDRLATIDTLYDLGFLLMDLDALGHRREANLLLGHYLWLSGEDADLDALAALPLFLGLRAAIRGMVGLQRAAKTGGGAADHTGLAPAAYVADAAAYLDPSPPRLVAVGGFSGTGKSTLAAGLAPLFGPAPGALHLRSDLERKRIAGVGETDRLPASAYAPAVAAAVYERLAARARRALSAGHAVIVDAVFADAAWRDAIEGVARDVGVAFNGLWLSAPADVLAARVAGRHGDASDATPEMVAGQLARGAGSVPWATIDAGGTADEARAGACQVLGIARPAAMA